MCELPVSVQMLELEGFDHGRWLPWWDEHCLQCQAAQQTVTH